mgnify:CR=1 FL=1
MAVTGGYNVGAGGSVSDYTFDDFDLNTNFDNTTTSQERNEQLQDNANEQEQIGKDNEKYNVMDGIKDIGEMYLTYKSIEAQSQSQPQSQPEGEVDVDSETYLDKQKDKWSAYQDKMDDIQQTPSWALNENQKQYKVASVIPEITGNSIMDVGILGLLIYLGFRVISKV